MSSVAIPASLGTADQQAEQAAAAVDASLVTLPETRLPVDARGLALGVLAALASVLALWWAQAFLVPLLLGIIISYTLNPLVAWLEHIKIPRASALSLLWQAYWERSHSAPTRCAGRCKR